MKEIFFVKKEVGLLLLFIVYCLLLLLFVLRILAKVYGDSGSFQAPDVNGLVLCLDDDVFDYELHERFFLNISRKSS